MNPEITKIIDQYLQGELSETDRTAFEKTLSESDALRKEFDLQQRIYEGAKRASTRTQVKQTGKSYHFTKKVQLAGIIIAIVATVSALVFFNSRSVNENESEFSEEILSLMKKLEKESPIDLLKSEFFHWNGSDSVLLSDQGVLLSIPENAFLLDGKPYSEKALIQWQEALDGATIVKSGLSTMAGDRLLETQGMFGIQAFTPEGKRLTVNPKTGIYVQVPVDEYKTGMQLFEGKKNAEGLIDWQNPKPLLKIPVPVDMSQLDFYPVGYEKELDKTQLRKDKKFRDSLYLSFSNITYKLDGISRGKLLFLSKCATCHQLEKDATGPKLAGTRKRWLKNALTPYSIIDFVIDWNRVAEYDPYALEISRLKPTAKMTFPDLKREDVTNIFDYVDKVTGVTYSPEELEMISEYRNNMAPEKSVDPANVIAFWNPKFNNTNLATREFETRMRAIHSTCNDQVLEIYTKNLDQSISELDAKVAKMGYREFEDFAAEQLGAVNPNNPHLKNLMKFYEKSIKQLRDEVHNNRNELKRKQQKWDAEIEKGRTNEQSRTAKQESQALQEEYDLNMKNVHKQLGRTVGFQIYGTSPIYNIDKYVMDATVARASATITDAETGKTAQITYNDFAFEVENADRYEQIFAYLFPSGINSYQRISGQNGKFNYPLNEDMLYDLAIVGISGKGYSYFQQKTLKKGDLGKISLKNISETELNASVEQLNKGRLSKPMEIQDELDWLIKEQKNYKEQKMREEQNLFRHRMVKIIFPCYECDCTEAADISIKEDTTIAFQ